MTFRGHVLDVSHFDNKYFSRSRDPGWDAANLQRSPDAVEPLLEAGEDRSRYSQLLTWEEERERHEAETRLEEEVAARVAAEEARGDRKFREARAAERERLEIACAADRRLVDDLRRERLAREQIEEDRRREEDELRRLRDQGRFRRGTRFDDWW